MKTAQALVTLGFGSALTLAAPRVEEANAGVARRQPSPTSELDRRDDWDWDDRFGGYASDLSDRFEDILDFDRRDLSASRLSARGGPEAELASQPTAEELSPTGHDYDHNLGLEEPAKALPGNDERWLELLKPPPSLTPLRTPRNPFPASHGYDHDLNTGGLAEVSSPPHIAEGLYPSGRGYEHDPSTGELAEVLRADEDNYLWDPSNSFWSPASPEDENGCDCGCEHDGEATDNILARRSGKCPKTGKEQCYCPKPKPPSITPPKNEPKKPDQKPKAPPASKPDHKPKQAPSKKTVSRDLHTGEKRHIPNIDHPMHARIARPSIGGLGKKHGLHA